MKELKNVLLILFVMIVGLLTNGFAEEIQVETGEDQILIKFSDPKSVHSVYLDEKPVWQGSGPTYRLEGLDGGTPYIVSVKDEDLTTQATFYVDTIVNRTVKVELKGVDDSESGDEDDLGNQLRDSSLNVHVFEDRIELNIDFVPSDSGILEVYRNGLKIGETSTHHYVDRDVEKETSYDYEVHGRKTVSEKELANIKEKLIQEGITFTEETLESIASKEYILGRTDIQASFRGEEVESTESSLLEVSFAHSAPVFYVNYNTFIPWVKLYVPLSKYVPWEKDYYAGGDNRSFLPSPSHNNYRTTVLAKASFLHKNVTSTCDVGITRHYDTRGNLIYTGEASMEGIRIARKIINQV